MFMLYSWQVVSVGLALDQGRYFWAFAYPASCVPNDLGGDSSAGCSVDRCIYDNRRPANDTLAKLQAASHTSGDAARPLPRLKMHSEGVTCNGRDAVANESAEALQRRAKASAVCQLQLVVRRPPAEDVFRHPFSIVNWCPVESPPARGLRSLRAQYIHVSQAVTNG